jgi:phage FluMu gp28-like protein
LVDRRVIEAAFTGGYDVGRKRDASELALVGLATTQSYPLRLAITLDRTPYDEQADVLHYALSNLPIVKMQIDRNGIGGNLAENTEKRFPAKAVGVDFTNASKTLWATDTKMLVQQRKAKLPVDREWARQIHSIKRKVGVNSTSFDAERTEKSHADKFWAWALALNGALALGRTEGDEVTVRSRRR